MGDVKEKLLSLFKISTTKGYHKPTPDGEEKPIKPIKPKNSSKTITKAIGNLLRLIRRQYNQRSEKSFISFKRK